ncbi:isochorismate synthase [Microcoleus sp. FACHB-1515]|uniref:isochorismate synthase n=1 Tax=Cyanophyceae TaxID=3028117 RepID=UPI00168514C7|nr:isochorismate synthase [Microcoleus sp. FACHB-1515]MBD2090406.1 isochorismate synthase [Microcoleus sp. FACHB-1515]
MPVLFDRLDCFQDCQDFFQFLNQQQCQLAAAALCPDSIISIGIDLGNLDPLAILSALIEIDRPYFYLEKKFADTAIAAGGQVISGEFDRDRFRQVRNFITDQSIHATADAAPRFFCQFTFFDNAIHAPAGVYLPQWQVVREGDRSTATLNLPLNATLADRERAWRQLQAMRSAHLIQWPNLRSIDRQMREVNRFRPAVISALKLIEQQQLQKLVLALAVDVAARHSFQVLQTIDRLRQQHPHCHVFATRTHSGHFIGASPERLLSVQQNGGSRWLYTDALAGSAARGSSLATDAALGQGLFDSPKERREHQLVAEFICDRLIQLGLTPDCPTLPTLLKLPHLQHLHTPIQTVLPSHLHPIDLVAQLHPTPAVAGLPSKIACEQIHALETFEREHYAAPLGWIDPVGNAEFIVGIRSALLQGDRARLYAGAGIVAGSNPDRELAEVKLKLQPLLQALV